MKTRKTTVGYVKSTVLQCYGIRSEKILYIFIWNIKLSKLFQFSVRKYSTKVIINEFLIK